MGWPSILRDHTIQLRTLCASRQLPVGSKNYGSVRAVQNAVPTWMTRIVGERFGLAHNRVGDFVAVLNDDQVYRLVECAHQLVAAFAEVVRVHLAAHRWTLQEESGRNRLGEERSLRGGANLGRAHDLQAAGVEIVRGERQLLSVEHGVGLVGAAFPAAPTVIRLWISVAAIA